MDDIVEGLGISEMISTERSSALLSLAGSFSTDEAEVRLLDRLNLDLRSFIGSGDLGLELELSEALPLESLTLRLETMSSSKEVLEGGQIPLTLVHLVASLIPHPRFVLEPQM